MNLPTARECHTRVFVLELMTSDQSGWDEGGSAKRIFCARGILQNAKVETTDAVIGCLRTATGNSKLFGAVIPSCNSKIRRSVGREIPRQAGSGSQSHNGNRKDFKRVVDAAGKNWRV